jgi:hypothetical protein
MDKITIERETLQQLHDEMETVEYDADPPKRVLALMETLRAALAAQPEPPLTQFEAELIESVGDMMANRSVPSRAQPAPAAVPLDEWHEDDGDMLWWRFPVEEPPWCGTPTQSDWPGYHTHFTPIIVPSAPIASPNPPKPAA